MPLSEQEQRLLDEMERSLYHNDADDVTTVGARRGRPNYTAVALGILAGAIGLALLVVGVIIRQPIVGILGFALMFVGALVAIARRAGSPFPDRGRRPEPSPEPDSWTPQRAVGTPQR
jgi:Protein of unknown function (DUF3040).